MPSVTSGISRVPCARAPTAHARPLPGRRSIVTRAAAATETPGVKDSVRCYMTAEGNLVCERLEPGNYRLSAGEKKTHAEDATLDAPRCDSLNPKDCLTYCFVMDDGSMVYEGLPSGDYQISKATDDDLPRMVEHAQKLRDGISPTASEAVAAVEKPAGESKGLVDGLVGKITGIFRST